LKYFFIQPNLIKKCKFGCFKSLNQPNLIKKASFWLDIFNLLLQTFFSVTAISIAASKM